MARQRLTWLVPLLGLFLPLAPVLAGTVLSSSKFAWSNNLGYINFENLVVDDHALSGFAWSENAGWIKFNPALGGVFNDGAGNLSGSAWGEQLGWINFVHVSIDPSTGKFSGTANGTLAGTINFDCPTYCDVRTDWRVTESTPVVVASGVGGGGYVPVLPLPSVSVPTVVPTSSTPEIPSTEETSSTQVRLEHVEVHSQPLVILPEQSGTLVEDTRVGPVIIEVPPHSIESPTIFALSEVPLAAPTRYLVVGDKQLVNDAFYDVLARDVHGNPVHAFSVPIVIALPLPANLAGEKDLAVYWLNETNQEWVLIPDAVFSGKKAIFRVNHLTKFAIFRALKSIPTKKGYQPPSHSIRIPTKKGSLRPVESKEILPAQGVKNIVTSTTTYFTREEMKKAAPEGKRAIRKTTKNWMVPVLALFLIALLFLFKGKILPRRII